MYILACCIALEVLWRKTSKMKNFHNSTKTVTVYTQSEQEKSGPCGAPETRSTNEMKPTQEGDQGCTVVRFWVEAEKRFFCLYLQGESRKPWALCKNLYWLKVVKDILGQNFEGPILAKVTNNISLQHYRNPKIWKSFTVYQHLSSWELKNLKKVPTSSYFSNFKKK